MAHDVDISVGADTSAVGAGLAELRNFSARAASEMQSGFAKLTSPGSLGGLLSIAFLEQVVEKAHQIHHEAARFGIDAEQLQVIGNAAKESGISLETVARAMNKMLIAEHDNIDAFSVLGIDMAKFHASDPAEKFLLIADAVEKLGINTDTYNAIAKIFGSRFGTEMIPMLIQGRTEIENVSKAMGVMSNATLQSLETSRRAWMTFLNNLVGVSGAALAIFGNSIRSVGEAIRAVAVGGKDIVTGNLNQLNTDMDEATKRLGNVWKGSEKPGGKREFDPDAFTVAGGSASDVGAGSAAGGASTKLAELERKRYLDSVNGEEKIVDILHEKWDLQDKLNRGMRDGTSTLEEEDGLRVQILEKENEIGEVQKQLNAEQEKYNEQVRQARDDAERDAEASERRVTLARLTAAGHEDIAENLRIQWEFEDKINDLTEQIDQAWKEGNGELAETLSQLRDQLATEEKITQQLESQKAARKAAVEFNQNRSGVSAEQQDQLRRAGKSEAEIAALGGLGTGIPGLGKNVSYSDIAAQLATNPRTGVIDEEKYAYLSALAARRVALGQPAWGFQEAAQAKLIATQLGAFQTQKAYNLQGAQNSAMLQYYNAVIAGRGSADAMQAAFAIMISTLKSIDNRLAPTLPGRR